MTYDEIYDLLVREASAPESLREDFVRYFTRDPDQYGTREFRFQGSLGFGGKFYDTGRGRYISCYSEDRTSARDAVIESVNAYLKKVSDA